MKHFALNGFLILTIVTSACAVGSAQYVERGNKLFDSGQYADAAINYQKAIQKDPNSGEAFFRLGTTLMKQARPAEAYKSLSRAAELLPKRSDVAVALADASLAAYLQNARAAVYYDRVLSISSRLLKEDAKSYDGLRLQGFVAMIDKHYTEAADLLRKADAVKPMQGEVVDALMQCLMQNNQGQEAEKLGLAFIRDNKT
jgi:Tfp pilus assembly protein PilF